MEDMEAVIAAARQGVTPGELSPGLLWVPEDAGRAVSLERYSLKPGRPRGTVTVYDPLSFNQLLIDNATAGHCTIYLNDADPSITAVLNGNGGKDAAGWGDLRVVLGFRKSPSWTKWQAADGKMMTQDIFAEFVEDNIADFADPSGAVMLEIASSFEVARSVSFRSAIKLNSGEVQFIHGANDEAKVAGGALTVPEAFTLALSPFSGMPHYKVPARFRYRLVEGQLKLGFKLQRIDDMMADIFAQVSGIISGGVKVNGIAPSVTSPY